MMIFITWSTYNWFKSNPAHFASNWPTSRTIWAHWDVRSNFLREFQRPFSFFLSFSGLFYHYMRPRIAIATHGRGHSQEWTWAIATVCFMGHWHYLWIPIVWASSFPLNRVCCYLQIKTKTHGLPHYMRCRIKKSQEQGISFSPLLYTPTCTRIPGGE